MLYRKIGGKDIAIPTRYSDLTWRLAKHIPKEAGKRYEIWLTYFTEIERIENRISFSDYVDLVQAVKFLEKEPDFSTEEFSGHFEYLEKEYYVSRPEEIQEKAAGPYLDMLETWKQYLQDDTDFEKQAEGIENIAKLLVEYTIFGEEYDYKRALARDIGEMNYVAVNKMVAFFLKGPKSSKRGIRAIYLLMNGLARKCRRVIMRFRKSLAWA